MLNTAAFAFGMTSTPVLATGIASLLLGLVVLIREQGSPIGRRYLVFSASIATYLIACGLNYAVLDRRLALVLVRLAQTGAVFIPYALVASSLPLLGERGSGPRLAPVLLLVSSLFALSIWTSDLFLAGLRPLWWALYPVYGPLGYLFIAYLAATVLGVNILQIIRLRQTNDRLNRQRLQWRIAAYGIGALGVVDFLPTLGVELYAWGFLPIGVFVAITAYSLIRFRLLDITPQLAAPAILQTMGSAVIVLDRVGVVRVANRLAHELFGVREPRLVNRHIRGFLSRMPELNELWNRPLPFRDQEVSWPTTQGQVHFLSVSGTPLMDTGGEQIGSIFVGNDISRRKRAERELEHLALYDELTGLPNRKLFFDRLEQSLAQSRRTRTNFAVLYLDMDGFKAINDTQGHQAGDTVLRETASRISRSLRESDTAARLGGDEFVVLCGELYGGDGAQRVARKLDEAIRRPIPLGTGGEVSVGVSIGIAMHPRDGDSLDALMGAADRRMYKRKRGEADSRADSEAG